MTKKFLLLAITLICFSSLTVASTASRKVGQKKNYREGEVLVKISERALRANANAAGHVVSRHRARSSRKIGAEGLTLMELPKGKAVEQAVKELARDPDVEYAQPNFIYTVMAVPNDPDFNTLWGLRNTGQTIAAAPYSTNNPGTVGADISAVDAWDITTDCSSVIVAVLDTGVRYTHDDLANNMWGGAVNHGYNFVGAGDNDPMDYHGHGTHVASTIGAEGNNNIGLTGVCWSVQLMAVKVLDDSGSGTTVDIVEGVNYAVANGAKVINMSLGGSSYDAAFNSAVLNASNSGVVLVAAAGNSNSNNNSGLTPVYPCNYTAANLICVAAVDQSHVRASFSNYGATHVDIAAPGTNIRSAYHGTVATITDNLSAGWTNVDGNWVHNVVNLGGTNYNMLTNPTDWPTMGSYLPNLDSRAYKSFNLLGVDRATLDFYAFIDTEPNIDYFRVAFDQLGADPFAGGGTMLAQESGTTNDVADPFSFDLTGCFTATCAIGFQLETDAVNHDYGVGILGFSITATTLSNSAYQTLNGTSMAAPHVAGAAAMLFAYNPNFTAADVVGAIRGGGTAVPGLTNVVATGRTLNLLGSLRYINPPTGVTATIQ